MLHKYLDDLGKEDRISIYAEPWDSIKYKSPYFSKNPRVLSISSGLLKIPDNYLLH